MRKRAFLAFILFASFFLKLTSAAVFTTTAQINITDPTGVNVVTNGAMGCSFTTYEQAATSGTSCGTDSDTSGNRTKYTCTYSYTKNYTKEGNWNATVQFNHSSDYNAYDVNISTGLDNLAVAPQVASDCTAPATCKTDPLCRNSSNEKNTTTIYTINWDTTQGDCIGYGKVWFTFVTGGSNSSCCGDDGVYDNFYYLNVTSGNCDYCNKGVKASNSTPKTCAEAACTSTGWDQTPCATLSKRVEPPSTPQGVCYGTPLKFMCNYTDGNGAPITNAFVNITIDSVNCFVQFDSALNVSYYQTNELAEGTHPWNCSAWKSGYSYVQTTTSDYNISTRNEIIINASTTPDPPAIYGTTVNFTADYRNATSNEKITDATCNLYVSSGTYAAPFNPDLQLYQVKTSNIFPGPNDWEIECNRSCFAIGRAYGVYNITFSGEFHPPILTLEDPIYSLNSSTTYHKIMKSIPPNFDRLSRVIGAGSSGRLWVYGMVTKPAVDKPACSDLPPADAYKILLVKNSSLIANTSRCPTIANFAGLIFEDNSCIKNATHCRDVLAIPYLFNFTQPIYSNISNSTYVLLNGEYRVVQDISKLRELYFNAYYRESNLAPSFLMRLSGQFTPSSYGIESFVKFDQFNDTRSAIDYYYFNVTLNPTVYKIKGMPNCENLTVCNDITIPHFWLDNELAVINSSGTYTHLKLYRLETLAIGYTTTVVCGNGTCDTGEDCLDCPEDCACSGGQLCCNRECKSVCTVPNDPVCNDGSVCTADSCQDAGTCSAQCIHTLLSCGPSDGCCPSGCSYPPDSDCPCAVACSNDAQCADPNPCTNDTCQNPGTCTAVCAHTDITTCTGTTLDNCCPSGCSYSNDRDCCDSDCTDRSNFICYSQCNNYGGCSNFRAVCNGFSGSARRCSNSVGGAGNTYYSVCCNGSITACTGCTQTSPTTVSCTGGACGDGTCDYAAGENCYTCSAECGCTSPTPFCCDCSIVEPGLAICVTSQSKCPSMCPA
jgi:hypothetical protein